MVVLYLNDVKLFLFDVKNRLKDINMQTIHSRIREKSNTYLNYCSIDFYPSTIASQYINTLIHTFSKRRVFTLLRTHSLPIKSNLIRWNVVNNNLCEKCDGVFVENEFHILFRCSKYKKERETYIPECFRSEPNVQTLHDILTTNDRILMINIALFLKEILKDRVN